MLAELINKYYDIFIKFTEQYDLKMSNVLLKKNHTLRVANLMLYLANELNLNIDDTILAFKIGLCHDLGRFKELKILNNKFNNIGFDHGACSNTLLFNEGLYKEFDIEEKDFLVVRKALYYHNKKDLGNDLNERELLFSKMIRDCDKIDIISLQANRRAFNFFDKPDCRVVDAYKNYQSIDLRIVKNKSDWAVLYLGFIRDLYFEESKNIIEELGYIDKFIDSLDISDENIELFNELISLIKRRKVKVYSYGNER